MTQEKSPQLNTAYWKCPVASVYVNTNGDNCWHVTVLKRRPISRFQPPALVSLSSGATGPPRMRDMGKQWKRDWGKVCHWQSSVQRAKQLLNPTRISTPYPAKDVLGLRRCLPVSLFFRFAAFKSYGWAVFPLLPARMYITVTIFHQ